MLKLLFNDINLLNTLHTVCSDVHLFLTQFQANSWKHLILKICKGSYSPLPAHYCYELHYLIKQMFKRNPKNRPSATTILARGCLAKLIRNCFPSEVQYCLCLWIWTVISTCQTLNKIFCNLVVCNSMKCVI